MSEYTEGCTAYISDYPAQIDVGIWYQPAESIRDVCQVVILNQPEVIAYKFMHGFVSALTRLGMWDVGVGESKTLGEIFKIDQGEGRFLNDLESRLPRDIDPFIYGYYLVLHYDEFIEYCASDKRWAQMTGGFYKNGYGGDVEIPWWNYFTMPLGADNDPYYHFYRRLIWYA